MRYIDLFAGCGGLSLGIENAGGELVFANEYDHNASESFRKNLIKTDSDGIFIEGPIEQLYEKLTGKQLDANYLGKRVVKTAKTELHYSRSKEIEDDISSQLSHINEVDLIVGGPPCQGFSNAGKGKKSQLKVSPDEFIDDFRNILYKYFLGMVELFNPKIILMENVKGLAQTSSYRKLIQRSIEKTGIGYKTISIIVNAKDFGIPQNRERIFFIGIREDVNDAENLLFYLPNILMSKHKPTVVVKDAISDLPQISANHKAQNAKIENEIPIGNKGSFGETVSTLKYDQLLSKDLTYVKELNSFRGRYIKPDHLFNHKCRFNNENDKKIYSLLVPGLYIDNPANFDALQLVKYGTVTNDIGIKEFKSNFSDKYFKINPDTPSKTITAHLGTDNNGFVHYGAEPRGLSVREAARIQSFPDWFKFEGPFTRQYTQIGNAVPPLLAKVFGEIFNEFLNKGFDSLMD